MMLERKVRDLFAVRGEHWIGEDVERPRALFDDRFEGAVDFFGIARLHVLKLYAQCLAVTSTARSCNVWKTGFAGFQIAPPGKLSAEFP